MLTFDEAGYLLSASTPGEDRWTEAGGPNKKGGLVPGHAYSVIRVVDALGHKLINIRNPWGQFEWDGDWGDSSPLWTQEVIDIVQPVLDDKDGTFWMSFDDFIKMFTCLNVCRVRNWQENRIRGKFLRITDEQDSSSEYVTSKWYYELELQEAAEMFIGVHQEDERIQGVITRRPFIDCGICVIRVEEDGTFHLVDFEKLGRERQVELQVRLEPGKYIVFPLTTGALITNKPATLSEQPKTPLLNEEGQLTKAFSGVIDEIFRKFDLFIGRELNFTEFKILYNITGPTTELTQEDF